MNFLFIFPAKNFLLKKKKNTTKNLACFKNWHIPFNMKFNTPTPKKKVKDNVFFVLLQFLSSKSFRHVVT